VTGNESDDGKSHSKLQFPLQLLPIPLTGLHSKDYVPIPPFENINAILRVDVSREDRLLGWKDHDYDLMCSVLDIPGHHFNLFAEYYMSRATSCSEMR
jgi:hypothetical protein